MTETIFSEISDQAEYLTEDDVENWVLPSIMTAYDHKLNYLAYKVYGDKNEVPDLAVAAFKESAKQELRTALNTFLFRKEHWRNGRDLDPYLRLCLNRLCTRRTWETNSVKVMHSPACPFCKELGRREILLPESGMLRCKHCADEAERLLDDIRHNRADSYIQCRYNLHHKFALHSKKGYKCPDCTRFIPQSLASENEVVCPYDDCIFIGSECDLQSCAHPIVTFSDNRTVANRGSDNDNQGFMATIADSSVDADAYLSVKAQFETELKTLATVIEEQLERVKRTNSQSTVVQKALMYQAYQKMLEEHPIEMVAYLVHQRQKSDFPIQSRIFQKYAQLVEDYMPFTIKKRGEEIDIVDLTDPDLALFDGISEFDAEVSDKRTIPNRTKEEYIGGRNYKNYGPMFIGRIIDVVDKNTGKSIKDQVEDHSFSQINMKNSVEPGTPVTVSHFRTLSHYEMCSLVFLQRTRRSIVDSVYFRLNNKKRKAGKK